MKRNVFFIAFIVWVVLWASFTARELFVKGRFADYKVLFTLPLDGKHAYVTGPRLYQFIVFANRQLPPGASYKLVGLEDGSLEKRQATYYLYPHIEKEDADFELIYNPEKEAR